MGHDEQEHTMFNASCIRRSAILGALACALLGATTGDVAAAQTDDDELLRAVRAQQCYYESCPEEKSTRTSPESPPMTAAEAQERYYSTYGEAEPIAAPVAPAPGNGTPWLTIAFAATVALVAASIAVMIRRRLRLRRRVARATT
jgi:hypothetical protein